MGVICCESEQELIVLVVKVDLGGGLVIWCDWMCLWRVRHPVDMQ